MRTTSIMHRRYRRQKRKGRGGRVFLRIFAVITLLLGLSLVLTAFGGVAGVGAVYAAFTQDLPDFTGIERIGQDVDTTFETTKIYGWGPDQDEDGNRDAVLLYEVIDPLGGDRQWVPLAQIPQNLVDATVAIEDKTFWTNQGFDVQGIGRAFYEYVLQGGDIQGGHPSPSSWLKIT